MIINQQGYGGGSPYTIKGQLQLSAPTGNLASADRLYDTTRTFISGTDTIRAFIIPTTANGTYYSTILVGGAWADENNIRFMVHGNTSSVYTSGAYYSANQSRTTTFPALSGSGGTNMIGFCMEFCIAPSKQICGVTIQNSQSSATSKSTDYYLFGKGDFIFLCVNHQREENGVKTIIANFVPATDGTNNGLLDTVSNTFYPVAGSTIY